jgi:hypothetical protein
MPLTIKGTGLGVLTDSLLPNNPALEVSHAPHVNQITANKRRNSIFV